MSKKSEIDISEIDVNRIPLSLQEKLVEKSEAVFELVRTGKFLLLRPEDGVEVSVKINVPKEVHDLIATFAEAAKAADTKGDQNSLDLYMNRVVSDLVEANIYEYSAHQHEELPNAIVLMPEDMTEGNIYHQEATADLGRNLENEESEEEDGFSIEGTIGSYKNK